LESSLLARLLLPDPLAVEISNHLEIAGARLRGAAPRDIDAPGYLSDLVGVTLEWLGGDGLPTPAVLKVSHAGFGREELPFYRTMAAALNCPVIPGFFAGGTDGPTGRTWVLLEDLSATHERPSEEPLPPTFARNAQLVEALAQFHAAGWDNANLHGSAPTLVARLRASDWLESASQRLLLQAGDAVGDGARELLARWLRVFPVLVDKAAGLQGPTVVHGDAHVWNWMLPRPGTAQTPKLIDWDGWHVGAGVWDLAYMMALQWDRELRQRFEVKLLDRYHAALADAGVKGYGREALQQDYRLAVLLHLRTPIARFARGMSAYVWWPQLTRIRDAVEDLDGLDLLD
jgi:hypothetical protein